MLTVTKELHFCCAHRLWEYNGPCFNIHGHNYRVLLTYAANSLNAEGMVVDFTKIKREMQAVLDLKYDHSLVLHAGDVLAGLLTANLNLKIILCEANPTAELFAMDIFKMASESINEWLSGARVVACTVYETETSYATVSADI